jgi:hypothetical protein
MKPTIGAKERSNFFELIRFFSQIFTATPFLLPFIGGAVLLKPQANFLSFPTLSRDRIFA